MKKETISETIVQLLSDSSKKKVEVDYDTDLIEEHILDSITFVQLVSLLEEKFNIKFTLFELMIENFRNINLITDMVLKVR
ncbi:acyl carrier protein [Mediterraneibacter gnavus]|uniref:Acyl carrier protein n=1 Tax=Mediterraneibacter gnavus TaxID=33038 RepID=A0AAJ3KL18_MEDGN|nr:acyl carrier protein [Mediterraneibacter gnavus]MBS6170904.1 acyl carrier protein [Clostridiales bacterium]MDU4755407.1 acyl carrier protein [Lachnospiraceae bacterium]NSC82108.1 acyl carrier protein [Mediterraneibacter gnavus]NSI25055.1 acyl carrier protein [Mediterraneibacter gnavus]NSI28341.1 acyl carrier protein [Mediterraneibacter gnavus]